MNYKLNLKLIKTHKNKIYTIAIVYNDKNIGKIKAFRDDADKFFILNITLNKGISKNKVLIGVTINKISDYLKNETLLNDGLLVEVPITDDQMIDLLKNDGFKYIKETKKDLSLF